MTTAGYWSTLLGLMTWHIACLLPHLLYSFNERRLESLWWLGGGVLIGLLIARPQRRWPLAVAFTISSLVPLSVWVRSLPIHSFIERHADLIRLHDPAETWTCEITNKEEVETLTRFLTRGHWATIVKSSCDYSIELVNGVPGFNSAHRFYIRGNSINQTIGDSTQTVFIPDNPGFYPYVKELLSRHQALTTSKAAHD